MGSGKKKALKIVINTGGGDAPGLNAVIRAVTLSALNRGWEVYGSPYGYLGLMDPSRLIRMTPELVAGITSRGGTILGTSNRGNPFSMVVKGKDGKEEVKDCSDTVVRNFRKLKFDGLIAVGGDGSLTIAHGLEKKGIPVIGVPKTIDNDLESTVITFGFDTAVSTATEAIDKLHSTAESHQRVMVVELMGRHCGWIALNSGISGSADVILIPEIPFRMEKVCEKIREIERSGRHYAIVVVAEGAVPVGGREMTIGEKEKGREARLGGIGQWVADQITKGTGKETRSLVLGHLQRGGSPTTFDRLIGLRFGAAAVRLAAEGRWGNMVALDPPTVKAVPLAKAVEKLKKVPTSCDSILTARELGICFGD